jgi:hypothetical protein
VTGLVTQLGNTKMRFSYEGYCEKISIYVCGITLTTRDHHLVPVMSIHIFADLLDGVIVVDVVVIANTTK